MLFCVTFLTLCMTFCTLFASFHPIFHTIFSAFLTHFLLSPHTSMIVTADASIVLVGPYLDRAYSVGGSSASSNGFGSLVGVLRPSTDSGKAFVLYELVFPDHFNATDLFLTAAEYELGLGRVRKGTFLSREKSLLRVKKDTFNGKLSLLVC